MQGAFVRSFECTFLLSNGRGWAEPPTHPPTYPPHPPTQTTAGK